MAAGEWSGFGVPGELPADQRIEDGGSVALDSAPLAEPLAILGAPLVELEIEVDRPCALLCARLSDIAPDGAATRVSYGLLNLTHRDGHADPKPLVPGERYRVAIAMNDIAHVFASGHRLRLALSFASIGYENEMRLSCQARVQGDCTVEMTPAFNWSGENFWQKPYPNK